MLADILFKVVMTSYRKLKTGTKYIYVFFFFFYFLESKKKWEIKEFLIVKSKTMNDLIYCLVKMLAFHMFVIYTTRIIKPLY